MWRRGWGWGCRGGMKRRKSDWRVRNKGGDVSGREKMGGKGRIFWLVSEEC